MLIKEQSKDEKERNQSLENIISICFGLVWPIFFVIYILGIAAATIELITVKKSVTNGK
jgi:hypothetical protein